MQEQPQQHSITEPRMETLVKVYKKSGAYQHEAAKLAKQGWTIKDTSQGKRNRSLAGKVIVPFGLFTKPTEILITYERPVGTTPVVKLSAIERKYVPLGMPQGLPFGEQAQWVKAHKSSAKLHTTGDV